MCNENGANKDAFLTASFCYGFITKQKKFNLAYESKLNGAIYQSFKPICCADLTDILMCVHNNKSRCM